MLTQEDKLNIYRILLEHLEPETVYPLSRIACLLADCGIRAADYGYKRLRPMLEELGEEYISLQGVVLGTNPQFNVVLHRPEGNAPESASVPVQNGQETVVQRPVIKENAGARISLQEKQEIYRLLTEELPVGEKLHMAVISKLLNESGYPKERFGYAKMKPVLMELSEFLSIEEVPMNGVPQSLITLRRMPEWEETPRQGGPAAPDSSVLPPDELAGHVYLPPKTLAKLNLAVTGTEGAPSEELKSVLYDDYRTAVQSGGLRLQNDSFIFPLHIRDLDGNGMIASIKPSDWPGGLDWFLNFAGTDRIPSYAPGRMLEQFAFLGSWSGFLRELAELALPEPWDFEGTDNYYILKRYIQYTFYRLQLEDKVCISEDHSFAAFNTGLVSRHYDDIFACFEAGNDGHGTEWRFLEFSTAAGRRVGKRLVECFNPLPEPASYFERKEDLFFDLEKELHSDFDHILLDNIARLPLEFIREECYGNAEAIAIVDRLAADTDPRLKRQHYQELSDMIADTPRLFNRMRNRIEDAIELAKKQVRWNFKTAIPCYFPTRNVMSLMLPLSLRDDNTADAALVVELTRSGNYQGQTILTLQQAYLDARLLCRPNSEWLNTDQIDADEEEDE